MRLFFKYFFKTIRIILSPILFILDKLSSPTPIERNKSDQALVDQQTQYLSLYQFSSCPFCIKVRRQIKRLGLNIEIKDAQNIAEIQEELIREGGKKQVPCLKIQEPDKETIWLYESASINSYLQERLAE